MTRVVQSRAAATHGSTAATHCGVFKELRTFAPPRGRCQWCGLARHQIQAQRWPCQTAPPAVVAAEAGMRGLLLQVGQGAGRHGGGGGGGSQPCRPCHHAAPLTVLWLSGPVVRARTSACSAGRSVPDSGAAAASCVAAGSGREGGSSGGWVRLWQARAQALTTRAGMRLWSPEALRFGLVTGSSSRSPWTPGQAPRAPRAPPGWPLWLQGRLQGLQHRTLAPLSPRRLGPAPVRCS